MNLPVDKRAATVDVLFNTTTGAGFSIVRNGIGSSPDSSSDHMNTFEPKSPGSPTAAPSYVWDGKDSGQVWVSQQAYAYGVRIFYGNAWSAPGFMKTNNNDANGGSLCGVSGASCSSGDWKQAYANYLVQYVKFYQQHGIDVTHLGFVNEPDLSTSYASMLSSAQQSADFIKVLRPTLNSNGFTNVSITCCEATGWNVQNGMTNSLHSVDSLFDVVTSHAYTSQLGSPQNTPHHVWQTEYSDLNGQWTTAWYSNGGSGDGITWAGYVHNALATSNCSAYLYWVATQGGNTNEKMIKIENNNVEISKRLWALAGYSRFIRPKAVRVSVSAGSTKTTAFRNEDGSVVVVVLNTGTTAVNVNLSTGTGFVANTANAYVVDNTRSLAEVAITLGSGGVVTGSVPARALMSFVLRAATNGTLTR